ncbi:MAG: type II secretion system protein [Verrucomicrobiota bacterium]|nr:type II secretion system protein [Verrucomicrobiota bacterium]
MTRIVKAHLSIRIKKSITQECGFTLLELIGVMTVIAILAAALLPSTIDIIQVQRSVNDRDKLPEIAKALKRGMLREQFFPIYENSGGVPTDGDDAFWWNLASRHGGGSANEVRYPLGVSPNLVNTRKLYFAQQTWGGKSFFEITGDGVDWLSDPLDPRELRILLLSTSNIDLPLPDFLTIENFDALWDKWSISNDGNPSIGFWSKYGLNSTSWEGRATELNIQRIDLRDWLSTVVIENRRAVEDPSGTISFPGDWVAGTLYAYAENLVDSEVVIKTSSAGSSGSPPVDIVNIDNVILLKRGKYMLDDRPGISNPPSPSLEPSIVVLGDKFEILASGQNQLTTTKVSFPLKLTNRSDTLSIGGWDNGDDFIQNRYFLAGEELPFNEPWGGTQVGVFVIDKVFSTLRFDGLQWHY